MCTLEKRGNIFILTLTGPGEHRLNPTLIDQIRSALSRVRAECATSPPQSPAALVTTAEGKYFSNGYDLEWASGAHTSRARQLDSGLRSIFTDLASLPLPTVAAVTGHASAAGFILAMGHDYAVMRGDRGFMYMSELDIGLKIPPWFVAVVRCRVGSPAARRRVLMAAAKVTAAEAVEMGLVDSSHVGVDATVKAAVAAAERLAARRWDGEVYAQIRSELFGEILAEIKANKSYKTLPPPLSKM